MNNRSVSVGRTVAARGAPWLVLLALLVSGGISRVPGWAGEIVKDGKNPKGPSLVEASPSTPRSLPAERDSAYVVGIGDVLRVSVWREPELSGESVVRPDGKITVPLVGDVGADGTTTEQLGRAITERLQEFLKDPRVTVTVVEIHSKYFYVVGEILRPGPYPLLQPTTVLQALSFAGGFREFANTKKIQVLRHQNGGLARRQFNYDEVVKGRNVEQNIVLKHGDTIVVP